MKNYDFSIKNYDSFIAVEENEVADNLINIWIGIDDNHNDAILKTLTRNTANALIFELKRLVANMPTDPIDETKRLCGIRRLMCPMIDEDNICCRKADCRHQIFNSQQHTK